MRLQVEHTILLDPVISDLGWGYQITVNGESFITVRSKYHGEAVAKAVATKILEIFSHTAKEHPK